MEQGPCRSSAKGQRARLWKMALTLTPLVLVPPLLVLRAERTHWSYPENVCHFPLANTCPVYKNPEVKSFSSLTRWNITENDSATRTHKTQMHFIPMYF